ncbi:MAG: formylglycine-generating enzyme family protein [Planctomycetaceae bacterium]
MNNFTYRTRLLSGYIVATMLAVNGFFPRTLICDDGLPGADSPSLLEPSLLAFEDDAKKQEMLNELLDTFMEEFVDLKPGDEKFPATFTMGSDSGTKHEKPAHEVTLEKPFAIAKYEVPQNLYEVVMGENPSKWKGPRNSVEMMTWSEADTFCKKITVLLRERKSITEDEVVRLPTEAEWEYACRAGTQTVYSFGDQATKAGDEGKIASLLNEYGWHTGNAAGNDPPVGALKPNPWGLYDMHGYLWEFVADDWHPDYKDAPNDGQSWIENEAGRVHVKRGGSWKDRFEFLSSSSRAPISTKDRDDAVGFRCVKSMAKPAL